MEDERGWSRRFLIDDHENVPIETMIMIATRAAIGMRLTRSPSTRIRKRSATPAVKVERRPRPPDFTLIIDWPIIAQPAMPPKNPVTELAMPWPTHSRFLSEGVSVSSSTIWAVIRLSSRPTAATPME